MYNTISQQTVLQKILQLWSREYHRVLAENSSNCNSSTELISSLRNNKFHRRFYCKSVLCSCFSTSASKITIQAGTPGTILWFKKPLLLRKQWNLHKENQKQQTKGTGKEEKHIFDPYGDVLCRSAKRRFSTTEPRLQTCWSSKPLCRAKKWPAWAHNTHLTQTTRFTAEAQGNHGQIPSIISKKYCQIFESPEELRPGKLDFRGSWLWLKLDILTTNYFKPFFIFSSRNKVLTGFNIRVEGGQQAWKNPNT